MVSFQGEAALRLGDRASIGHRGPGGPASWAAGSTPTCGPGRPAASPSTTAATSSWPASCLRAHRRPPPLQDPDPAESPAGPGVRGARPAARGGRFPDGLWRSSSNSSHVPDDRPPRRARRGGAAGAHVPPRAPCRCPGDKKSVRDAFRGDYDGEPVPPDPRGSAADPRTSTAPSWWPADTNDRTTPSRIVRMAPGERRSVVALVAETSASPSSTERSRDLVRRHFEFLRRVRRGIDRFEDSSSGSERQHRPARRPRAGEHDLDRAGVFRIRPRDAARQASRRQRSASTRARSQSVGSRADGCGSWQRATRSSSRSGSPPRPISDRSS